jgi:ubiquitin-protein ligase
MIRSKELIYIFVEPDAEKFTQWHFLFEGPPETPYAGGFYHGALVVISAQIFGHVSPFSGPSFLCTASPRRK